MPPRLVGDRCSWRTWALSCVVGVLAFGKIGDAFVCQAGSTGTTRLLVARANDDTTHEGPASRARLACDNGVDRKTTLVGGLAMTMAALLRPSVANARVKGAAELDLEYYLRDLLNGNPLTGGVDRSQAKVRPGRTIDRDFATFLDAATLEELSRVSGLPLDDVTARVSAFRAAVEPSFQRRAAFPSGDLSNEYCLDCYMYSTFRIAAREIPDLAARALFVRGIGEKVLSKIESDLNRGESPVLKVVDAYNEGLDGVIAGIRTILQYMKDRKFLKGFRLDYKEDLKEAWEDGFSVEFQVTAKEPATMGSNLQFTGEGYLFHPEHIANTLQAYLRRCRIRSPKYLQYFLDTEYRENVKDYTPSEVLYQLIVDRN